MGQAPRSLPAVSSTESAAAAAIATRTTLTFLCNVDVQGASVQICTVHGFDRAVRVVAARVSNETETTAAARFTIGDNLRIGDLTEGRECFMQPRVISSPAQTANKNLARHVLKLRVAHAIRITVVRQKLGIVCGGEKSFRSDNHKLTAVSMRIQTPHHRPSYGRSTHSARVTVS